MLVAALFALADIYQATNGEEWTDSTGWLTSTDHCEWYGVMCSSSGEVVRLYLYDNALLTGSIPTSIGDLVNPEYLYLYDNALTGSIPASIGDLVNLYSLRA